MTRPKTVVQALRQPVLGFSSMTSDSLGSGNGCAGNGRLSPRFVCCSRLIASVPDDFQRRTHPSPF